MAYGAFCKVVQAGPMAVESGYVNVCLREVGTENVFNGRDLWFRADPKQNREVLAVALAAITSRLTVALRCVSEVDNTVKSGDASGYIETIYLVGA